MREACRWSLASAAWIQPPRSASRGIHLVWRGVRTSQVLMGDNHNFLGALSSLAVCAARSAASHPSKSRCEYPVVASIAKSLPLILVSRGRSDICQDLNFIVHSTDQSSAIHNRWLGCDDVGDRFSAASDPNGLLGFLYAIEDSKPLGFEFGDGDLFDRRRAQIYLPDYGPNNNPII